MTAKQISMVLLSLLLFGLCACSNNKEVIKNTTVQATEATEAAKITQSQTTPTEKKERRFWIEPDDSVFAVDNYEFDAVIKKPHYMASYKDQYGTGNAVRAYEEVLPEELNTYLQTLYTAGFRKAKDTVSGSTVYFIENSLNKDIDSFDYDGTSIKLEYNPETLELKTTLTDEFDFHLQTLKNNIDYSWTGNSEVVVSTEATHETHSNATVNDELLIDSNGKQLWKVYTTGNKIHFNATFTGSGHFSIKLLDDNQNFVDLICSTIGDYIVDKSVDVTSGKYYYIELSTTDGFYEYTWSGTVGK